MSPAVPRSKRTFAVISKADLNGKTVCIYLNGDSFQLFLDKEWIATSNSSKRLAQHAFDHGVKRCVYDFDLAIDEE